MFRRIISWYKIWKLRRQIAEIERENDEFYLNLSLRNEEFQKNINIDSHYKKFVNLRNLEKKELKRQIKSFLKRS
jgi:hypothetical protein